MRKYLPIYFDSFINFFVLQIQKCPYHQAIKMNLFWNKSKNIYLLK